MKRGRPISFLVFALAAVIGTAPPALPQTAVSQSAKTYRNPIIDMIGPAEPGAGSAGSKSSSPTLPEFDFTRDGAALEWGAPHHIESLRPTADGLEIVINGYDPYFHGPARDYPTDTPLWLIARLKSDQAGAAEVFYFRDRARAGDSVQFNIPAGRWVEARVPMPPLGPGFRLRFDPPGSGSGRVVLASLRFEERVRLPEPSWPAWASPTPGDEQAVTSGDLGLFLNRKSPLGVELRVQDRSMAFTYPRPRIGYLRDKQVHWVDLAAGRTTTERADDSKTLTLVTRAQDTHGAEWIYRQRLGPAGNGTIAFDTSLEAEQDREVVFMPMHLIIAGANSFGARKGQGLFAGLEYLEDEPSSSEADIIGPESNRRVPAAHKITFPLMAIQAEGRYVGLIWEEPRRFSALFDSPDRTFGSDGHVMGVLFPGEEAAAREEGSLLPYGGALLKAHQPVVSRAWLIGGAGESVVPAVQHYVRLRGLPPVPETGLDFPGYVSLASQGWLSSKIREGNRYRHAFWPGFGPQAAADAAVYQAWLAGHAPDPTTASELTAAAKDALSVVPPRNYYHAAIGHVRMPLAPLVFGTVPEAIEAARQSARAQLKRFEPDGTVRYHPAPDKPDYGRTHFEAHANGLTAQALASLLEAAAFSSDRELIARAVERLDALERYRNTVPRGAQTWEVPLHTPDILASAHLVRACTLGYQLTGRPELLDQAVYWAWTGMPFVYLVNPTDGPVGPYSTIAVLGATNWKAPVWFGRPVQWCGMVYADALYRLAAHDSSGPWKQLADGITAAGIQHTWRADDPDRAGLLPDFFELREQLRAGPAINPGTVGASAPRLFGKGALYEFRTFRRMGVHLHAPGEIVPELETDRRLAFRVRGWSKDPYWIVAAGFNHAPTVKINGTETQGEFDAGSGRLILQLSGAARVDLELGR